MEAVPKLPMFSFELKLSPEHTQFGPTLQKFIRTNYHEDGDSYANEIKELETLRQNACKVARDFTGCSTLKRYYSQLKLLQNRFPIFQDPDVQISFTWCEMFSGSVYAVNDIKHEQGCILYNIGALHSELGAVDNRHTSEGMKVSCTHFQCAAWALQQFRDEYSQHNRTDFSYDLLSLYIFVMLAQAQECILEKSMQDNRKSTIISKVSVQICEYYKQAQKSLNSTPKSEDEASAIIDIVGSKQMKTWKKYIEFKISYYKAISYLYQGNQAEEQQKMGERLSYYQRAEETMNEAVKLSKNIEEAEIKEAISFTLDVISAKLNAAKKENDFIYHEKVPPLESLPELKGASLVKGIPFDPTDPEVSGPDIFGRLVPIEAHETSSLYSEEKAKLLRHVSQKIEDKNQNLTMFLSSLKLEQLNIVDDFMQNILPQELIERCAALSVRTNAIPDLVNAMQALSGVCTDVSSDLKEMKSIIFEEENKEKEYQGIVGKRAPSMLSTELKKEMEKYEEAHNRASESNATLHKALSIHLENLKQLALPLDEVQKLLPSIDPESMDQSSMADMKKLLSKIEEMKQQRIMLENQLREQMKSDDITKRVMAAGQDADIQVLFGQELKKYDSNVTLLDQNMLAQENILLALTDKNAKFANTRKMMVEISHRRERKIQALLASYDAYEDLLLKTKKGTEFYEKLQNNVSKLHKRMKSVCNVQEEERLQIIGGTITNNVNLPRANVSTAPKLKDYLAMGREGKISYPSKGNVYMTPQAAHEIPDQNTAPQYATYGVYSNANVAGRQNYSTQKYIAPLTSYSFNSAQATIPQTTPHVPKQDSTMPQQVNKNNSYPPNAGNVQNVAPEPQYSTPRSPYSVPASQYTASVPQFSTPRPKYSAPSSQYGVPNIQYSVSSAPKSQYSVPASQYSTPTTQCSAPTAPTSQYPVPSTQYSAPTTPIPQYSAPTAPMPQYSAPTAPMPQYSAPVTQYLAPASQYSDITSTSTVQQPNYNGNTGIGNLQNVPSSQVVSAGSQIGSSYSYNPGYGSNSNQFVGQNYQRLPISDAYKVPPTNYQVEPSSPGYLQNQRAHYHQSSTNSSYSSGQTYPSCSISSPYRTEVSLPSQMAQNSNVSFIPQSPGSQSYQPQFPFRSQAPQFKSQNGIDQGSTYTMTSTTINYPSNYYQQENVSPQVPQYQEYGNPNPYYQQTQNYAPNGTVYNQNQAVSNYNPQLNADQQSKLPEPLIPQVCPTSVNSRVPEARVESLGTPDIRPGNSTPNPSPNPSPSHKIASTAAAKSSSPVPKKTNSEDILSSSINVKKELNVLEPKALSVEDIKHQKEETEKFLAQKDPYADSEVLAKFTNEVKRYEKFVEGLTTPTLMGQIPLNQKWEEVTSTQEKESRKLSISVARCCPIKNRNQDLMPYDQNRVEIKTLKDDYINASFVTELNEMSPKYIVTQAPLPITYTDFWTMVWEQQTEVIICLLSDAELKDHIYWPTERGQVNEHGPIKLSLQSIKHKPYCAERMIKVNHHEANISRVVVHLQFTCWPSSGLPESPIHFLQFISDIHYYYKQQRSLLRPIVVHCSGGSGRSGILCLLYAAMQDINCGRGILNVLSTLNKMATQRKYIINDKEQLRFCYESVLYHARDVLLKRGILTNQSSFETKAASSDTNRHVRHPSQDFILGSGSLASMQSKLGFDVPVSTSSKNDGGEESRECNNATESDVTNYKNGRATSFDVQTHSEQPSTDTKSELSTLLDPQTFNLDCSTSTPKRKINKEDFSTSPRKGSFQEQEKNLDDPLSMLDPLWTLKK